MPRPLKWGILGASAIILSKDIDKYAFMSGSNFNETDVRSAAVQRGIQFTEVLPKDFSIEGAVVPGLLLCS